MGNLVSLGELLLGHGLAPGSTVDLIKGEIVAPDWRSYPMPGERPSDSPERYEWVELDRDGWDKPQRLRYRDIPPALNIVGLRWRPAPWVVPDAA